MHGTLALPTSGLPTNAILVVPGSGPVDRDGNQPGARNFCLRGLAHALAADGAAVLRFDKHGVSQSLTAAPPEHELRFATYVDDVGRWLDFLSAETGAARSILVGHSEGALIATLVAQQRGIHGLVLIAGAGRPIGDVIRQQLRAAMLPPPILDTALGILASLEQGITIPDPAPELHGLFRPSVQPYLISWLRLDPVVELRRIAVPTLAIHGTNDLQVDVEDGRELAVAGPHVRTATITGMNHVLKPASLDRIANFATYDDPYLSIAPELVSVVSAFLR